MSDGSGAGPRGIAQALRWLTLPLFFPFRPGFRMTRDALRLMRQGPTVELVAARDAAFVEEEVTREERRWMLAPLRARSRRLGRLFGMLLVLDLCWEISIVLRAEHAIFSPRSVELLAIAAVLGGQFLVQTYMNWQARTGQPGGFFAFLADGRNLWPR